MRLTLVANADLEEASQDSANNGLAGLVRAGRSAGVLDFGELTIGRDPRCSVVVVDKTGLVSGTHCRILRDATGFWLRDESTNGLALDGRDLVRGETMRLADGARIDFCDQSFHVRITGDEEPDWSDPDPRLALGDEAPSITAILADVSPVGRPASGIIPGRLDADWMEPEPGRQPRGAAAPALSRAPIGWSGPPDASTFGRGLPDDWDAASDAGSRNEHVAATSIRMRLPKSGTPAQEDGVPEDRPASGADADALVDAFIAGFGAPIEPPGEPAAFMRAMGGSLRQLIDHLVRLDDDLDDLAASEGVERARIALSVAEPGPALSAMQLEHRRLLEAVRALLAETDRFAPASIEARAMAKPAKPATFKDRLLALPAAGRQGGPVWQAYRAAYGADGTTPRSRFAARLRHGEARPDDDFEELSSDRPARGAAR